MKVQIEVGKGIQCDGIEIMFGDSISSVVKAVGEVDKYKDNTVFMSHHFQYMQIRISVSMKQKLELMKNIVML